jgi:signal transduction histidine kinase
MNRIQNSLLVRLLLLFFFLSLVPLGILTYLTSRTSKSVEGISIQEGSSALVGEARGFLRNRTVDYARQINLQLEGIENDARLLAIHAGQLLTDVGVYRVPFREERYERAENGIFWTPRDHGGSNLFISTRTEITREMKRKIAVTELIDPVMKEIFENDPNSIYIFLASEENLVRGYPWFDAVAAMEGGTLDPNFDLKQEPLYYLAKTRQGEEREEVWSEVYLDPAGKGWMVTCVSPVYLGDTFHGIIGIDVSLERIRDNVLDLELSGEGYAFLLTGSGNVLAAPPEASEGLGWEMGTTPDRFNLMASSNTSIAAIAREMVAGEVGIRQATISGLEMLVSFAPVETAHWSLGLMVSLEDITRRALMTADQIEEQTGGLIKHMMLISTLLLVAVAIATVLTYRWIAGPLNELVTGVTKIGSGELGYRVRIRGGDEIGQLARTFNDMAESLQRRQEELAVIQAKLLTSEKLSSMGKVAAAVAHEIRNSLGTIKNSIYFLNQKVQGPDQRINRHLSLMEEEIESADRIVNELLDFTKGSALQLTEVSVNALIDEVLSVYRERGPDNVTIREDFESDLSPIRADPAQVRHVFYNIIQNSIQAMDDGGILDVATRGRPDGVTVTVRDSGHGIGEEEMDQLFEPFFTTKARGIGLGLAISRKIVQNHGGKIRIESVPGEGTTVTVELMVRPPDEGSGSE